MGIYRILMVPILICIFCTGSVSAAEYPAATTGTIEGLEEFISWLCDLGRGMIDIFRDAIEMIGLSDETYVGEMIETLEDGLNLVNQTMDS